MLLVELPSDAIDEPTLLPTRFHPDNIMLDLVQDNALDICILEGRKDSSEEMTTEQARASGKQLDNACNMSASEMLEGSKESNDEIIFEPQDPSRLTVEERQFIWSLGLQPEELGYDYAQEGFGRRPSFEKSSEGMMMDQAEALAEQLDHDGSQLTSEQRRAIYKLYFAWHLKDYGLRSPQYYPYFEEQSNPASASDEVWPGAMGYVKANRLKRSYIDPEDLIERLRQLKPSENFELRKHRRPTIEWERSPPREKARAILEPSPEWLHLLDYRVSQNRRRLGNRLAERIQKEIRERWKKIALDIDQAPTPDLHLLKDMGHSPGGTPFPRYLVKGLGALREQADSTGDNYYYEEYKVAECQKEKAIDLWKERHFGSILKDDLVSLYRTWPADLTDELDDIDRESIRRGRRRYIDLLTETEKKMQELVAFWRDCGAITGQRTPPLSWWLSSDLDTKEPLLWPPRLKERLDAINVEFGFHDGKKLRLIEISRWKEAIVNSGFEPAPSDTPFPQSLLDELYVVWRGPYTGEEMEDEMFEAIGRWRKAKDKKRAEPQINPDASPEKPAQEARSPRSSEQGPASQPNNSDSAIALEELPQLHGDRPRGTRRTSTMNSTITDDRSIWRNRLRPRTNPTMANERTSWCDRLRPRPGVVDTSRNATKAAVPRPGKPRGIIKHSRKTSRKAGEPAKGHTVIPITPEAEASDLTSRPSHLKGAPFLPARSARPKQFRRQLSFQRSGVQPQGIRKMRNTEPRQTRGPIPAKRTRMNTQEPLYLPTPP